MVNDSMNTSHKLIALKPYLECIANDCSKLNKQELVELILALAKSEKASGRGAFLEKLKSLLPGHAASYEQETYAQDLLDDIQALKEDIEERIEMIEEGDYEELDDFDWEYSDYDEEPDFLSEGQLECFENLFKRASKLFIDQHLQDARLVYKSLFDLLDYINTYDPVTRDFDIDIKEERARFARCTYDAIPESKRLEEFAKAMVLDAPDKHLPHVIDESLPLLRDVIDAREEEMGELNHLFRDWKELLENLKMSARTASLLIEATQYLEGIEGVAGLARQWGNTQPCGYLFWMNFLLQKGKQEELIEVCEEALHIIQPGEAREKASQILIEAARLAGRQDSLLKGKREKFFSNPGDLNLLVLQNEAAKQNLCSEELDAVLAFWDRQKKKDNSSHSLYLKTLLMAGRFDEAFQMVMGQRGVGWSYGLNIGVVFGAVALALIDGNEDALILKNLLAGYANKMERYSLPFTGEEEDRSLGFCEYIIQAKELVQIPEYRFKVYLDWVFAIGRERIEHIVSNKHRNAYARAAQVLGSLAEVHAARGEALKASQIIHEYLKEKYSRHVAFRREVEDVLKTSGFRLILS